MRTANLTDEFGVELLDLDLSQPLTPDVRAEIRRLFETRHLVLVRRQAITPDTFVEFVGGLGTLRRRNADGTRHAYISNVRPGGLTGGGRLLYHSDAAFFDRPVWGLALHAEEITPSAAPTVFVSATAAYDRLPTELQDRVEGLDAVHLQDLSIDDGDHRWREADIASEAKERFARAVHPVVLRGLHHLPPVLFVGELHTSHIAGLEEKVSEDLLEELLTELYRPEHVYEHPWEVGDLIVWNNVALQHGRPPQSGPDAPRTLRRAVLTAP